jgi:hypothetical protein
MTHDVPGLVDQFGLAVALVIVTVIGLGAFFSLLWLAVKWLGREMIIPFRDRHFVFLDRTEKVLDKVADLAGETKAAVLSNQGALVALAHESKDAIIGAKLAVVDARSAVVDARKAVQDNRDSTSRIEAALKDINKHPRNDQRD